MDRGTGQKTITAFIDAINYLCPQVPGRFWKQEYSDKTAIKIGGYLVRSGKAPSLYISILDRVETSSLVLVPHKTTRGPNGLWIIRRGPEHPLVKFFEGLSMYVAVANDGFPRVNFRRSFYEEVEGALYTKNSHTSVQQLKGDELLEALAMVDQCTLDGKLYAYSHRYQIDLNPVFLEALHRKCRQAKRFHLPESVGDMEAEYVRERMMEVDSA